MQKTTPVFAMIAAMLIVSTLSYQSVYAQTGVGVDVGVKVGVGVSSNNETGNNPQDKDPENGVSSESQPVSNIRVFVSEGTASIKIESEGKTSSYVLDTKDESEILASIEAQTGLSEQEIRAIWNFEIKSNEKSDTKSSENSMVKTSSKATVTTHLDAKEKAIEVLTELKNRLSFIEERFQTLIVKLESGTYFGNTLQGDETIHAYKLTLDGSSVSKSNVSTQAKYSGELFLESMITTENQSKFKVTGGQITIDGNTHEVVFGKARTSLGFSGEKDTMIVICQVLDDMGQVTTLKLLIETEGEFNGDFGSEPVFVNVISQKSKVSSKWSLDGTGQIMLV